MVFMTVIVWDGKTLAADKRASNQGTIFTVTKIRKIRGNLVGAAGDFTSCVTVLKWFEDGADETKYPECQKDKDRWVPLVVITPDKKILRYEGGDPVPYEIEQVYYAYGSGRDYAIGALAMGATAVQAVEAACQWDSGCGNGIDTLEFD